jgi:hypothetical protein
MDFFSVQSNGLPVLSTLEIFPDLFLVLLFCSTYIIYVSMYIEYRHSWSKVENLFLIDENSTSILKVIWFGLGTLCR